MLNITKNSIKGLILMSGILVTTSSFANQWESVPQGVPAPALNSMTTFSELELGMLKSNDEYSNSMSSVSKPVAGKSINDELFDKEISAEMNSKFQALNNHYEMKKEYHLDRMEDRIQFAASNKDLADWTMKKMIQTQADKSIDNLSRNSEVAKTVGPAVKTVQIIQNTSVTFSESTKAKIKIDIPHGSMRVGFTSPVVNSSINYKAKPVENSLGNPTEEKLSINLNRELKMIRASTNANYGLVNQSLNYGVDKHIVGPISAGVGQSKYLKDSSKDETVGKLNFGLSF